MQQQPSFRFFGVGGTNGSGKGSLCNYLAEGHGFLYVPLSDILREELRRQGRPIERSNLRRLSTEWRNQYGYAILVERAYEFYKTFPEGRYSGLVVDSIRNPFESEKIHELGGKIIWVDADINLRYKRVMSRLRSPEDQKTFAQFSDEEAIEMNGSDDAAGLCGSAVKQGADMVILNETDELQDFYREIEKMLHLQY